MGRMISPPGGNYLYAPMGVPAPFGVGTLYDLSGHLHANYWPTDGSGEQIIDISNPAEPEVVGVIPPTVSGAVAASERVLVQHVSGRPWGAGGTQLFEETGWQILDVSDPAAPQPAALITPVGSTGGSHAWASGRFVYFVDDGYERASEPDPDHFRVFDITTPSRPVLVADRDTVGLGLRFFAELDRIVGQLGPYLLVYESGYGPSGPLAVVHLIDVSDPAEPVAAGTIGMPYNHFVFDGAYAYGLFTTRHYTDVAHRYDSWDELRSLVVLDMRVPTAPVVVSRLTFPPGTEPAPPCPATTTSWHADAAVAASGGYVYLLDPGQQGLLVVDARDPAHPAVVQTLPTNDDPVLQGPPILLTAVGGHVYVTYWPGCESYLPGVSWQYPVLGGLRVLRTCPSPQATASATAPTQEARP